jgi:hypothetical protein
MIVAVKDHSPETQEPGGQILSRPTAEPSVAPTDDSRIDEMSESSFPASDPPSAWTWEVKTGASTPEPPAQR